MEETKLEELEQLLKRQEEILEKMKEQKLLVTKLRDLAASAKKQDAKLNEQLLKAKGRLDWVDACKEHGINPEASYNTFKRTT